MANTTNKQGFISQLNNTPSVPDATSKCLWQKNPSGTIISPHTSSSRSKSRSEILPNIIATVGNTPLVRLDRIAKKDGLEFNLLGKCEFFNPGGSVKDRIGFRMISDAEEAGILQPGISTIIEPTSGNTGIGLAIGAAVKGYRCIIVISEKMSDEKIDVLQALGAEIVRTPITANSGDPDGLFNVAYKLHESIPNSIILDQYSNPGNPLAHYDDTAEELLEQCNGKIDMIVIGTGTGGTITGIGRKIKEKSPNTLIIGADPYGSLLALPEELNNTDVDFYEVEGIGYDFLPTGLDRNVVDKWLKVNDKEALTMARRLIREEGLLCGGSSGAAMVTAIKAAQQEYFDSSKNVVVLLPDSIRNYITKFVSDSWMEAKGFQPIPKNAFQHSWWNLQLSDVKLPHLQAIKICAKCSDAVHLMDTNNTQFLAVIDDSGYLKGVLSSKVLLNNITRKTIQMENPITTKISNIFCKLDENSTLGLASQVLRKESIVLIVSTDSNGQLKPISFLTQSNFLKIVTCL